jgi:hypothetical protein
MTRFLKELCANLKEQADESTSLPNRTRNLSLMLSSIFFKQKSSEIIRS